MPHYTTVVLCPMCGEETQNGAQCTSCKWTYPYTLFDKIEQWARDRNFFAENGATPAGQFEKTEEEVDELEEALAADNIEGIKDGIGDVIVTLVVIAKLKGLNVVDCIQHAYDEIKDRKGKMVNGVFVKEVA